MDVAVNQHRKKGNDGLPMQFEVLSKQKQVGVAWRVNTTHTAYLEVDKHSVLWKARGNLIENGHDFANIINGLRPRSIFVVPRQQGVCLPHLFIQDDGATKRSISTTFRLKSHPDVLVVVEDSSASKSGAGITLPMQAISEFWAQYEYSGTVRKVSSLWSRPSARMVKLSNRFGMASFVKITRDGGETDFAYLAIANGNSDSRGDFSNFQLFATRDTMLAKKKGVVPISESNFLALVEGIAKSIKQVSP